MAQNSPNTEQYRKINLNKQKSLEKTPGFYFPQAGLFALIHFGNLIDLRAGFQ